MTEPARAEIEVHEQSMRLAEQRPTQAVAQSQAAWREGAQIAESAIAALAQLRQSQDQIRAR